MKNLKNPIVLLAMIPFLFTGCKKDDPFKAPEFNNFKIVDSHLSIITLAGQVIQGSEEIMQYGVFIAPEKNMNLNDPQGKKVILNDGEYYLNTNVGINAARTLYAKAFVVTKTNIYYSETRSLFADEYYTLSYKGGKMMVTNHKYEVNLKGWGDYGIYLGASDKENGKFNMSALLKNNINRELYKACNELKVGGYTDWYVPSIEELIWLGTYKSELLMNWSYPYFSSTEVDDKDAWTYSFSVNKFNKTRKTAFGTCRCIRRE